jgi:Fe-S-cluster containining protein
MMCRIYEVRPLICRIYEVRPLICREFEMGEPDCVDERDKWFISLA